MYGVTIAFLVVPSLAEPLTLEHHFVAGQTWTYHLTAKGEGRTTLQGLPGDQAGEFPASFTLQGDVTWTVESVSEESVADLVLRVKTLTVNGEIAGEGLTWQLEPGEVGSATPSPPQAGEVGSATPSPPQAGEVGSATPSPPQTPSQLRLQVKPNGKVMDEKGGLPAALQSLPPALQGVRLLLRHVALTPLPFPNRPVEVGEAWEQEHLLELPYLESAPTPLRLTYRWQDFTKTVNGQRCASIRVTGEAVREDVTVPFAPWPARPTRTVDLTVDKLRQTFDETCYFAPKAGRLERRQWETDFDLTATATVPTPPPDPGWSEGGEQDVGVKVTWNVTGTLMRRNTAVRE